MTFEQAAKELIRSRRAEGTRDLYTRFLARWLVHCTLEGVAPAKADLDTSTKFREALDAKFAPLTVRCNMAALSKMYRYAVAHHAADYNPFDVDALDRPSAEDFTPTEEVSDELVDQMFEAAKVDPSWRGLRDYALFRLLYDTGVRREGAAWLLRENVLERVDGFVARVRGKGRKMVEVELPAETKTAIDEWLAVAPSDLYVFPARSGGRMALSTVNKILERRSGKKASPHQFRAAFASHALDVLPLHEVQAALHHADPKTTLRYDRHARGKGVTARVSETRKKR